MRRWKCVYRAAAGVLSLWAAGAHGLPDPRPGAAKLSPEQIEAIAGNPALKGVRILPDHELPSSIYVTPASRKTQAGAITYEGYIDCEKLEQMYELTYRLPPLGQWETVAERRRPYSPYFDFMIGNHYVLKPIFDQINVARSRATRVGEEHAAELAEYETAKTLKTQNDADIAKAQSALDKLDQDISTKLVLLSSAKTPAEAEAIRAELEAARQRREREAPELARRIAALNAERPAIQRRYAEARGKVAPYLVDMAELERRAEALMKSIEIQASFQLRTLEIQQELLKRFDTKPVAQVSIGYSLWDNEQAEMQKALGSSHRVAQLPLFNIVADSSRLVLQHISTVRGGSPTDVRVEQRAAGNPVPIANHSEPVQTGFRDADNRPIMVSTSTFKGGGAGVIPVLVTQGAYCRGKSEMTKKVLQGRGPDGETIDVQIHAYEPATSSTVQQQVAVSYNFHAKSEPIKISCEFKIEDYAKLSSEIAQNDFFVWKKKWEKHEFDKAESIGLKCRNQFRPTHLSAAQQEQWDKMMEENFSKDMMAQFILMYGKKWDVKKVDGVTLPEKPDWGRTMGPAMQTLCQGSVKCQIVNVAMQAIHELVGIRSGEATSQGKFKLSFRRDYEVDTYYTDRGDTIITVEVRK